MSAPLGLEYKNATAPDVVAPPDEGVIEALVAVTGVKDDVGDVIVPGAFTKTLQTRKPKVCLGHDWNRPIGKTLQIRELMPGDPNLPKTTADGKPWPKEAGAVWAQFQANMAIDDGKNAFHSAKFYGPESTYSIGYKATSAKHRGGTRYINELDLFEYGPVLHPANRLATLQSIKSEPLDDIEYTDADADEEKGVEIEELTLRDYAAILDIMEEKAVKIRRVSVSGAAYWGMPPGTIIRPGMKPQGTGKGGSTNRGLTTAKPANMPKPRAVTVGQYAITRDGYAGEVIKIDGGKVTISKTGEAAKVVPLADVGAGEATPDKPILLKLTGTQRDAATYAFADSEYSDEELGARLKGDTLEILDIGRAADALDAELEVMQDNPDRKRSMGRPTTSLRKKIASLVEFEDSDSQEGPEPADEDEKPVAKPEAAKPTESLEKIQKIGEELGFEVRPNPAPPEYVVRPPKGARGYSERVMSFESDTGRARASNGQVIPPGRAEEFMRTWHAEWEKSKDGYEPRADVVLSQMDRPAREAAAKQESERKKREALAGATDEQLNGQAQHEVSKLALLDEHLQAGRGTRESQAKARAATERNLDLVNEELTKRGLATVEIPASSGKTPEIQPGRAIRNRDGRNGIVDGRTEGGYLVRVTGRRESSFWRDSEIDQSGAPTLPRGLEEFGPEAPGLSTKPTGGRSIEEILDSLPVNTSTQNVRYRIAHGEDVLDDPTGSGLFAVMDSRGKKKEWTVTVGSGMSLPTGQLLATATNDKTAMPTTPKKMTAWLTALGSLRDANGNPPQYGAPDSKTTLAFTDAEGRGLAKAIEEIAVPAYLASIGKDDGFQDRSTPAMWKRDPATAMSRMPKEMRDQLATMGLNGRQAYYLNRSEGNDHATALQRSRDMIANARGEKPTGPSYAPVNTETATGNQVQPTPPGEISTDRLLMMSRVTGPAAIAAMELPELERHDAELARRAAELGKPGQVSPAHKAIKDALSRKRQEQRLQDQAEADAQLSPEERRKREIEQAPSKVSDARQLGRMSRGEIALREVNKEFPLDNISGNAYNTLRANGVDAARQDGVASAELARNIASDAEFVARADAATQVADIIDSWGVDLGEESDYPAKLRAWADGARSVLNAVPEQSGDPEVEKIRQRLAEQTDDPAQARRSGIPSRGFLAFSLAKDRLGMTVNPLGYASVRPELTPGQMRERAREHAREAYLAGGIEGKLTEVERALNEIDSWNVDFGRDQALLDNTRAWVNGSREGLAERPLADRITSVSMEDGRTLSPITPGKGERQALGLTSGDLTLRVYELERPSDVGRPWAYDIVNNATGETTEGQGLYSSPGSALVRAEGEFQGAERRAREAADTRTVNEQEEDRRLQAAQDRAAAAEAATPDQATARANAQARREAVRRGETVTRPAAPAPGPVPAPAGPTRISAEDQAEIDRLKSEGRDNEAAKLYREAVQRARAAQRQDTITPELLDEAAESEAASVGLSETPDGALEVEAEVADRQDRVEKLIKSADDGKLNLAEQSTEDLTATRRDLVDELRLQTAVRRRSPAPRPAPTEAPKTRPGLAGAAEDHAEALRSGDAAAIERTRARLESSIRRSRTDSEIARSLADSVTSPDDNNADQLSDLAKRLRAESRERRNAATRKRRAVKRIERARLQSLLGAVDTELRGRGVELEQVAPELLAPDAEDNGRPSLTAKQKAVMLTADENGWVVGHGVTINSLVNNNLAQYSRTIPPDVRQRGSSWVQLNENGLAELALLRNP